MDNKLKNGMLFLSMPYSSKIEGETQERYNKALKVTAFLMNKNIHIISPILMGHQIVEKYPVPGDYNFWQKYCEKCIDSCSAIILFKLKGWEDSIGVKGELEYAKQKNLPVFTITEELEFGTYFY